MYAVIETGGHQYRVSPGQVVKVEKLAGEVGDRVTIDKVLLVAGEGEAKIGTPYVQGATVTADIASHGRHKKIIVFKKRRRKTWKVKKGHKQHYTALTIREING